MMPWRTFLARAATAGAIVGVFVAGAVVIGVKLVGADPGGPPTRNWFTFAGVLRNPDGGVTTSSTMLRFVFHRIGMPDCAPTAVRAEPNPQGAFSVLVSIDSCGSTFFNGTDISYDVYIDGEDAAVAIDAAITPVPYARFADQASIANSVRSSGPYGLGLSLAGGRLCVTCNGAPCNATNTGYVVLPTNAPGELVVHSIRSEECVSGINSQPFGASPGVPWASPRPFGLYACDLGSARVYFALSPNPSLHTTPSSTSIGYVGSRPITTDSSMFFWTTNDVSSASNRPCLLLGAVRMTKPTGDNWSVSALDHGDGIGRFFNYQGREYDMPQGQMGAAGGSHFSVAGGSAPQYERTTYTYRVGLDGLVSLRFFFSNATGGGPGTGAEALNLHTPFRASFPFNNDIYAGAVTFIQNGPEATAMLYTSVAGTWLVGNGSRMTFQYPSGMTIRAVRGSDQSQSNREIRGSLTYAGF